MKIIIIIFIIIIINQEEEDGGHMDLDSQRKGKSAVIKTSTRQVMEREGKEKRSNKERKNSLYLILFSDVFFACHWPRRSRKAQTRRPSGT